MHTFLSQLMASTLHINGQYSMLILLSSLLLLISTTPNFSSAATPRKLALVKTPPIILKYHKGQLLKGNLTVNLIWYGRFTSQQKSIITTFLQSLSPKSTSPPPPSVASWWRTTASYKFGPCNIVLGKQILDQKYSLGKSLTDAHLATLAFKSGLAKLNAISVVLTSADTAVEDFCMNRCGSHGYTKKGSHKFAYAWVGNSGTQCPGQCAWPFAKPIVGPQTAPLVAPNGDVGADGMVINLATVLAGAVTNPFDGGYFQGPATAPLEAVTACTGIFGSGAFPGYPGKLLVDRRTRASYNAQGASGRKYLLPAMWDPATSKCKPLV